MFSFGFIRFIRSLPAGRAWAYIGVLVGFGLSITANVAETVLTETPISLALRLPQAIAWPALTYVAIEVLTRTMWQRFALKNGQSWAHMIVRLVLIGPVGGIAAYSSYLHQSALFARSAEPTAIVNYGPIAIDGMLFACTAALIITKVVKRVLPVWTPPLTEDQIADLSLAEADREFTLAAMLPQPTETVASIAPVSAPPARTRAPRAQWDAALVTELAVGGTKASEAHEKAGIGVSTYGRYTKVAKMLKANPAQHIDVAAEKVPLEHVEMMRKLVSR